MSQQTENISTLNSLIETLKDGQEGFRQAAEAVKDSALKSLFNEYSMQRSQFAGELQNEAIRLGEPQPEDSSSFSGSLHRAWTVELERRFPDCVRLFAPSETQAARVNRPGDLGGLTA